MAERLNPNSAVAEFGRKWKVQNRLQYVLPFECDIPNNDRKLVLPVILTGETNIVITMVVIEKPRYVRLICSTSH
jgi:hypothetical protein